MSSTSLARRALRIYRTHGARSLLRSSLAYDPRSRRLCFALLDRLHGDASGEARPEWEGRNGIRSDGGAGPWERPRTVRSPERGVSVDRASVCEALDRLDPEAIAPVLRRDDVTDFGDNWFVADPFLHRRDGVWHLFFEVYNPMREPDAAIGHATSTDGRAWNYEGIVLETDEHLSFPYVFERGGETYMIPEEGGAEGTRVTLYRATDFPGGWEPTATLVDGDHRTDDAVAFRWKGRWWLLVGDADRDGIYAYHSDELEADDWTAHAGNPVVCDRPRAMRPGGRPIVLDDRVIAFYQDCADRYGERVRAFEILELGPDRYVERELEDSPALEGTGRLRGWNSGKMHHVDLQRVGDGWVCATDGNVRLGRTVLPSAWSIGTAAVPGPVATVAARR